MTSTMFGFVSKSASVPRRPLENWPVAAEVCEARTMLDGHVTATLVDGVLTLTGDRADNMLTVFINADGTVTFQSPNTGVNGLGASKVTLEGTVSSITGSFGRGRDVVVIEGVVDTEGDSAFDLPALSGNVTLAMGRGRDQLTIRGLNIGGQLSADGGRHRDRVTIESVNVGTSGISLSGGRGRDTLAVRDTNVDGDVNVAGGRGRDRLIQGDDVTVAGASNISGGRGRDRSVVAPVVPEDTSTETDAQRAIRELQQAAVDSFFANPAGGAVSSDIQQAWNRENDPLNNNSIDSSVFPTTFPSIDSAQFTTTDSGLQFRIVDQGSDVSPAVTDDVTVAYQGLLLTGTQFDGTDILDGGGFDTSDTATFALSNLIQGWQEGLPLIGEGGRIQLLIPSSLAYGENGTSGVPANATLFFNVELVSVG